MSLQDESFPTDELFDNLDSTIASKTRSLQRQCCVRLELPQGEDFQDNESPFLNSDCSEETCASDPVGLEREHEDDKNVSGHNNNENGHVLANPLGSARSSKAVSYQDIHSAYTKRRYKHVTSKVKKYIAELDKDKEQQRRNVGGGVGGTTIGAATGSFQRHRSMPESLTPRGNAAEEHGLDGKLNETSGIRDESYERLLNEKDFLQSHINYLESKLYTKIDDNIVLRKNFDAVRNELSDFKEKMKRQTAAAAKAANNSLIGYSSLHSLMHYPPSIDTVTKATQTDRVLSTAHHSHLSDLSDMPAIAANATPHANVNLNDITYDSSAGSIEIPLLSVRPAVPNLNNAIQMNPQSLNFSNDSGEVDSNGNALNTAVGVAQRSSNRNPTTNNSGSSHPSSNDSAIDIENHESRSPQQPQYRGQTINFGALTGEWNQRQDIIYFDRQSNRVVQLVQFNPAPTAVSNINSNSNSNANSSSNSNNTNNSIQSESFGMLTLPATGFAINRRKKSLAYRMLRLFGPCTRCDDPNQTLDATNATYTVAAPLLADVSSRV